MGEGTGRRAVVAAAGLLSAAGLAGPARAQEAGESTFDRVRRTKALRIAALPGEAPYFVKDLATGQWGGTCILMAQDIARVFDATLDYVEGTYASSVLDLQSNKIDLAFALAATPQRAMAIGFTEPTFVHPYGCLARHGFDPKTWADLNKPDLRVVFDIGSLHETAARRYAPRAQLTGFRTRDEATLAFASGKADALILAAILGLSTVAKNPALGPYHLLTQPLVALPSNLGIRREPDTRFRDVLDAWVQYNRGTGQVRDWILQGLALGGVRPEDIPPEVQF